jgi:hypothetical protein
MPDAILAQSSKYSAYINVAEPNDLYQCFWKLITTRKVICTLMLRVFDND